jgi:myo-inositol-1(or 4)-monophosphatase
VFGCDYLNIANKIFKPPVEACLLMIQQAISAAKEAGDYLLANFRKDAMLTKERGVSKEIVTKYDHEADRMIVEMLSKSFPSHNILTEESGLIDRKGRLTWHVDSLDGTGNYANSNPFFSVSIALLDGDKPLLAVVYAPFLGELYTAERGKGSFRDGKRIRVSQISDIGKSYIVACEGGSKTNKRMSKLFDAIYPDVKDMRKIGSAAIEGALVASGRADAYATLDIYSWDVAAAVLLVTEAGGRVTDFGGKPWKAGQSDVLMSNGLLHDQLLKRVENI